MESRPTKKVIFSLKMEKLKNKVPETICRVCHQVVVLSPTNFGWVHKGGGAYVQKCGKCGWIGSKIGSFQKCPKCGEHKRLVDDHCVRPQ